MKHLIYCMVAALIAVIVISLLKFIDMVGFDD